MTKITLSLVLLAILGLTTSSRQLTATTAFSIRNSATEAPGLVVLSNGSSQTTINITSTGDYISNSSFSPNSIEINAQSVVYPNTAIIMLPDGFKEQVSWQSTTEVIIGDGRSQNAPS